MVGSILDLFFHQLPDAPRPSGAANRPSTVAGAGPLVPQTPPRIRKPRPPGRATVRPRSSAPHIEGVDLEVLSLRNCGRRVGTARPGPAALLHVPISNFSRTFEAVVEHVPPLPQVHVGTRTPAGCSSRPQTLGRPPVLVKVRDLSWNTLCTMLGLKSVLPLELNVAGQHIGCGSCKTCKATSRR
jgi:hypothetical protein